MKTHHPSRSRAFTLIEVLIVIVIILVIAGLSLSISRRAMNSAKATKETGNLHQVGLVLNVYVSETGSFPIGWEQDKKISWVDLLIAEQMNGNSQVTQMPMFWSPLLVSEIPANLKSEAITHFAANPAIMTRGIDDGTGTIVPQFKVMTSLLRRPSEQIVLCGAVARTATANYHASEPVLWEMEAKIGGPATKDNPPQLDPANANTPIPFPIGIAKTETYGSMPDFHRYGDSKGQFFFADGHVESMAPAEHREKNWAVSY